MPVDHAAAPQNSKIPDRVKLTAPIVAWDRLKTQASKTSKALVADGTRRQWSCCPGKRPTWGTRVGQPMPSMTAPRNSRSRAPFFRVFHAVSSCVSVRLRSHVLSSLIH